MTGESGLGTIRFSGVNLYGEWLGRNGRVLISRSLKDAILSLVNLTSKLFCNCAMCSSTLQ